MSDVIDLASIFLKNWKELFRTSTGIYYGFLKADQ